MIVLDLHGYKTKDALLKFFQVYNETLGGCPTPRIKVIHGYGSSGTGGVIIWKLRAILAANWQRVAFDCGEDLTLTSSNDRWHALGYTIVTPIKPLQTFDLNDRVPLLSPSHQPSPILQPAQDFLATTLIHDSASPKKLATLVTKYRSQFGEASVRKKIDFLVQVGLLVRRGKDLRKQKLVATPRAFGDVATQSAG